MNTETITVEDILQEGIRRRDQARLEALIDRCQPVRDWYHGVHISTGWSFEEVIRHYVMSLELEFHCPARDVIPGFLELIARIEAGQTMGGDKDLALITLGACTEVPVCLHPELWDRISVLLGKLDYVDERVVVEVLEDEDLDQEFMRFVRMELKL